MLRIAWMKLPGTYAGSPAWISGTCRLPKMARSCARATWAPRQKCTPPPPNPTCGLGLRLRTWLVGRACQQNLLAKPRDHDAELAAALAEIIWGALYLKAKGALRGH